MALTGKQLIAGQFTAASGSTFKAKNPTDGSELETEFYDASETEVDAALQAAQDAGIGHHPVNGLAV